jgi:hypothetical protein
MERGRKPSDTAAARAEYNVRHFRRLLYVMTAGFLATEVLA